MKPTLTCHIARSILKRLGSDIRINPDATPTFKPVFPDVFQDSTSFRNDYLAYNLCRKVIVKNSDCRKRAIEKFIESERACAVTNLELVDRIAQATPFDQRVILRASQLIAECIGDKPPSWFFSQCTFTGGASTSRRRSEAHPALKWWASQPLHVTPLALPLLTAFHSSLGDLGCVWDHPGQLSVAAPVREREFFTVVPGSRLDTVVKDYEVDRVILIEADGNMLIQKGAGNVVRQCLASVGIDLSSQRYNQKLAYEGSVSNRLATVDLRAASDSIALAVPAVLLPTAWFDLLYRSRAHLVCIDGEWRKLEKLSSMGNGFTFEVETLIFWSLTQALIDIAKPKEKRIAVYGDDIVCASSVFTSLERIFGIFGFSFNVDKSFHDGPFRESCGKHYHLGTDVTPVYIKGDLDELSERFRLANQLDQWDCFSSDLSLIVKNHIPAKDQRQIPLQWDETSGLYQPSIAGYSVKLRKCRHTGSRVVFHHFSERPLSMSDRFEDECRWFYQICNHIQVTKISLTRVDEPCKIDIPLVGTRAWQVTTLPAVVTWCDSVSG